jgi:hypothetical protein
LQVIDRKGTLVQTLKDPTLLDTPWDLAINDGGNYAQVFVSNVKSGTVSWLDLRVEPTSVVVLRKTLIATGYTVQPNSAAVILGPTTRMRRRPPPMIPRRLQAQGDVGRRAGHDTPAMRCG